MTAEGTPMLSAGDCPVCSDAGALLFVVDERSGRVLLHCPHCECAWETPNDVELPGDPGDLRKLGVTAVRAATAAEIGEAGLSRFVAEEHPSSKYPIQDGRRR